MTGLSVGKPSTNLHQTKPRPVPSVGKYRPVLPTFYIFSFHIFVFLWKGCMLSWLLRAPPLGIPGLPNQISTLDSMNIHCHTSRPYPNPGAVFGGASTRQRGVACSLAPSRPRAHMAHLSHENAHSALSYESVRTLSVVPVASTVCREASLVMRAARPETWANHTL